MQKKLLPKYFFPEIGDTWNIMFQVSPMQGLLMTSRQQQYWWWNEYLPTPCALFLCCAVGD